jgi:hypothetical protein
LNEVDPVGISSLIPKLFDPRPHQSGFSPESLQMPTRLFRNATETLGAVKDYDDSSDEETVRAKVLELQKKSVAKWSQKNFFG